MSKIVLFIRWFFGIVFLLVGLIQFGSSPISGTLGILLGLFISPKSPQLFSKLTFLDSRKKKIAVAVALFFGLVLSSPQTEGPELEASSSPTPITSTTSAVPAEGQSTESVSTLAPTPLPTASPGPSPVSKVTPVPTITPNPTPDHTVTPTPKPKAQTLTSTAQAPNNSSWSCDCSKTCKEMSYEEAQYQLNACGCTRRDGDDDGEACER